MAAAPPARLYGRRKGKRLRRGQHALLDALLPRLALPALDPARPLAPPALFAPGTAAVWLEIGFGGGEHLLAQARRHPEVGFIGCEPFLNGVVKLLAGIAREGLANIRVLADDGRPLLAALASGSIARAFVLFPDPWPKKRHHKRRLIAPETLDQLARVLIPGGELRLATDDPGLAAWMLDALARHGGFAGPEGGPNGLAERPAEWPPTRYEAKARARGAACVYLAFRRREASPAAAARPPSRPENP
jgi:tRNA (guanine-N7-)-methyltransferase